MTSTTATSGGLSCFGLFAGAAFGRYTDLLVGNGDYQPLPRTASHSYIQGGVRAVLFP